MGPRAGLYVLEKGEISFLCPSYCTDQAILPLKYYSYFVILGDGNSDIGVGVFNGNCLCFSQYSVELYFRPWGSRLEKLGNHSFA